MVTTVVKTIGSGGDYTTLQAWEDASPANLVTADQVWQGQIKNASDGFTAALIVSGSTTDATRYKELTTATGASFIDNASAATNALRFNKSNGCWIEASGGYTICVDAQEPYFRMSRIQVNGPNNSTLPLSATATGQDINQCIIAGNGSYQSRGAAFLSGARLRNSLIQYRTSTSTPGMTVNQGSALYNCTLVNTGSSASPAFNIYYTSPQVIFKNVAVFGFTALTNGTANTSTTCYTDIASPPTGWTGGIAFSTATFGNVTSGSEDFKLVTGSALLNVGTTDSTYAATDILGTARPQGAAYDVGVYEAPVSGNTAALTGQAATASAGTLAPSNTHALTGQTGTTSAGTMITGDADAISGQAGTTSTGTASPSISIGLTGQSATAGAGTMTTGSAAQAALTGQAATMSAGALTTATATALAGAQGSVGTGTMAATPTFGIAGQSAATASGIVAPSTAPALAGSVAAGAQGSLLVVGDLTVALTGQSAAMGQGYMSLQQLTGAGRPRRKFQIETSRGIVEVDTLDEVAQVARVEKRTPRAPAVAVKLDGMRVSTPSLKPSIDYKAIEERMRAAVQAEIDDEEELLMMLL